MKYIRTKDGKIMTTAEWLRFLEDSDRYFMEMDDMIAKQADSIDELCDVFVLFSKGEPYFFFPDNDQSLKISNVQEGIDMRGAICIEGDLKYVAKTNEKGEWEPL